MKILKGYECIRKGYECIIKESVSIFEVNGFYKFQIFMDVNFNFTGTSNHQRPITHNFNTLEEAENEYKNYLKYLKSLKLEKENEYEI